MTFRPPPAGPRRLAVRVTRDAERRIRAGHPWVFDGSITSVSHDAPPGDLAVIFDHKRDFLAIGLWDPASWGASAQVPSSGTIFATHAGLGADAGAGVDHMLEQGYAADLAADRP